MRVLDRDLVSKIKHSKANTRMTNKEISEMYNVNINTVHSICNGIKSVFSKPDFNTGMLLECLIGGVFFESKYSKEEIQNAVDKYHGVFDKNYYGLKSRI